MGKCAAKANVRAPPSQVSRVKINRVFPADYPRPVLLAVVSLHKKKIGRVGIPVVRPCASLMRSRHFTPLRESQLLSPSTPTCVNLITLKFRTVGRNHSARSVCGVWWFCRGFRFLKPTISTTVSSTCSGRAGTLHATSIEILLGPSCRKRLVYPAPTARSSPGMARPSSAEWEPRATRNGTSYRSKRHRPSPRI